MFIGTVPKEAKIILGEVLKIIPPEKEIWVGCSGNFTIDKLCAKLGRKVHSNDVSLYSKLIADIVIGSDSTPLTYKDESYKELFDQWEESKYKKLIMVMFVMNITEYEPCKNDYQTALFSNYINQHQDFYKNTLAKFARTKPFDFEIENFFYGDFRDSLENCTGVGFIFPPTYTGGYEKMYKRIDEMFDYPKADYKLFDSENAGPVYAELMETKEMIIYSDRIFAEIEQGIVGKIKMAGDKRDIYIYSSVAENIKKMFLFNKDATLKKTYKTLPVTYEFTKDTKIQAIFCETKVINHYKHLYMGTKVNYSLAGDFGILFFADGQLFGFASFIRFLGTQDQRTLFLQSDFVVNHPEKKNKQATFVLTEKRGRKKANLRKNSLQLLRTSNYSLHIKTGKHEIPRRIRTY